MVDVWRQKKTPLHACCIEGFDNRSDLFLIGLYELNENGAVAAEQVRQGGIMVCDRGSAECLYQVSRDGGVLDLKTRGSLVAVVYSTGCLEVFELVFDADSGELQLLSIATYQDASQGLFLSVDWALRQNERIAVSTQSGSLLLFTLKLDNQGERPPRNGSLELIVCRALSHTLFQQPIPAWIVAWDCSGTRLLSGGDDCALHIWDAETMSSHVTPNDCGLSDSSLLPPFPPPLSSTTKAYSAGVTSGAWHPTLPYLLAAGSYDETVKLWDTRMGLGGKPICTLQAGGGVWRTKWWEAGSCCDQECLLALACMHGGCSVYSVSVEGLEEMTTQESNPLVCRRLATHIDDASDNHLAYGIHLFENSSSSDGSGRGTIDAVSCSFYDNSIFSWKVC